MKLDLREATTKEEVYEHFELFKEAYTYEEYMSMHDLFSGESAMEAELAWFNEHAPNFLPVLDRWVMNHVRAFS